MAVSKHNLWKRKKNGLMKLIRPHAAWKKIQNAARALKRHTDSPQRFIENKKPINMSKEASNLTKSRVSSVKRTQVGKKI